MRTKEVRVSFIRRIPLEEKTCPVCGKRFEGVHLRVYCSAKCREKAQWERTGANRSQARREKKQEHQ